MTHLHGRFTGILVSDRWVVFDDWPAEERQLCWAHVKRNWEYYIVGSREAKELRQCCLAEEKKVFELWHLFKDGKRTREQMQRAMKPHIDELSDLLSEVVRSSDASRSACCQRLPEKFAMYSLFTSVEDAKPTNKWTSPLQKNPPRSHLQIGRNH